MSSNFSMAHAQSMLKFIREKTKELSLLYRMLEVQSGVKMYKRQDINMNRYDSLALANAILQECSILCEKFLDGSDSSVNYVVQFFEKAKIVDRLIKDLKKKTNFFRNTIFGDILEDLAKATTKFKETVG